MANTLNLNNLGSQYDQSDRINQAQGYLNFNPNAYIDPRLIPLLQMQAQQQQFNQQNPRAALPQNFGSALGGLASRALTKFGVLPGQPQDQAQQSPQGSPVVADLTAKRQQYIQNGMNPGEALYQAATEVSADDKYQDPGSQQIIAKAITAAKGQGFDPETAQKESYNTDNFQNQKTGVRDKARRGTAKWQALESNPDWIKAGDVPLKAAGDVDQFDSNGMKITQQQGPGGGMPQQIARSTGVAQFINNTSGTPQQMSDAGVIPKLSTASATDKEKIDLATQEANTKKFYDQVEKIKSTITDSNGAAVGKPGDVYEKADNWIQTARQLAGSVDQQELLSPSTYNFKGLDNVISKVRGSGIDATKYHAQMLSAAYLMTALQNPDGDIKQVSKERVQNNLDQLAEHSSDPKAILATLQDAQDTAVNNIRVSADSKFGDGQGKNQLMFFGSDFDKQKVANAPKTNSKGWVLHTDKNGAAAYVSPDGKDYEMLK